MVLAIDHRANLLDALNRTAPRPLSEEEFAGFKNLVISALAGESSAVLTDPAYGIGVGVASRAISGRVGLLAPIEVTNYDLNPGQRSIEFIPDWSVSKIKRMGGDGVKLLLPYHPDAESAQEKLAIVRLLVDQCAQQDIPLFLEPIPYALDPGASLSTQELRQVSVEMARTFCAMGVDILKMLFPVNTDQDTDETTWTNACQELDAACSVPWVILSAGVNYDTFERQARIACQAGASGVIVGRALWNEAVQLQGNERVHFLATTAQHRIQTLATICRESAVPWFQRVQAPKAGLEWYTQYPATS